MSTTLDGNADSWVADVLFMQRELLVASSLPADHLEGDGVFGHQRAGAHGATILPLVPDHHHHAVHCRPHAATGTDADGAQRGGRHGLRHPGGGKERRGAVLWRLHGGSRNLSCHREHSAVGAEQPGQRHTAGSRHCAAQRHRAMRAAARDEDVPGQRGPLLRQGTGRVRGVHVLHDAAGGVAKDTACTGEQEAGQTVWDGGAAEAGHEGRARGEERSGG